MSQWRSRVAQLAAAEGRRPSTVSMRLCIGGGCRRRSIRLEVVPSAAAGRASSVDARRGWLGGHRGCRTGCPAAGDATSRPVAPAEPDVIAGETGKPIEEIERRSPTRPADPVRCPGRWRRHRGQGPIHRRRGDHEPGQGHDHLALGDGADLPSTTTGRRTGPPTPTPARSASTCAPRSPAPRPRRRTRHRDAVRSGRVPVGVLANDVDPRADCSRCSAPRRWPTTSSTWPSSRPLARLSARRATRPTPRSSLTISSGPLPASPDWWWSASGRHRRTTRRSPRTTR